MPQYRGRLPQLSDHVFLTDSGLETELIFLDRMDLPCFAAFTLLKTGEGLARLRDYYQRFATTAKLGGYGLVLESPTWRANPEWAAKVGYSNAALAEANRKAIYLMVEIRDRNETLMAGCLMDWLADGLSAVYSFYEPDAPKRSLGTQVVLWMVAEARRLGLPYVYLGYWVPGSDKMDYKASFAPFEVLLDGRWRPYEPV